MALYEAVGFVIDGVVRRFGDTARITSTSSERIGPAIQDAAHRNVRRG
ncbi:MAG: hypothetical protein M3Q72_03845 [Actinomycetota bacterium]|nr:hypothetical protein [Actinomycetota bacterium]